MGREQRERRLHVGAPVFSAFSVLLTAHSLASCEALDEKESGMKEDLEKADMKAGRRITSEVIFENGPMAAWRKRIGNLKPGRGQELDKVPAKKGVPKSPFPP